MDRKIVQKKRIDTIIEKNFKAMNFDCSVCGLALRGLEDVESHNAYGMCQDCQDLFYWPNKDRWNKGWRPKKAEVHEKLNNYYVVKEK